MSEVMTAALELEKDCFACGSHNPIGLQMKFQWEDDRYVSRVFMKKEYQSFEDSLHGGMVGLLLDEVIGRSLGSKNIYAVTARLEVDFRLSTPTDTELMVCSWVESQEERKWWIRGAIYLPDGSVSAEAKALMIQKKEE